MYHLAGYRTITRTVSRICPYQSSLGGSNHPINGLHKIHKVPEIQSPTVQPSAELSKDESGRNTVYYQQTEDLIERIAQTIVGSESPMAIALADHMIDNTCHFDCDRMCCVTKIMNRHKIHSSILFMQMHNNICHNTNRNNDMMCMTDAENYLARNRTVDLSNGMAVLFRKDQTEKQIIDIERYDGVAGSGEFYKSFLQLILRYVQFSGEQSIKKKVTQERIQSVCRSVVGCSDHDNLYRQFVDTTTHMSNDTMIDLTQLMDLYEIESYELFHAMVTASRKYNMGATNVMLFGGNIVQKYDRFDLNTAKRVLKERNNYIDIYDGISIKNMFRKSSYESSDDVLMEELSVTYKKGFRQSEGQSQCIDIKRFDNQTDHICFYKCILNLLNKKINDITSIAPIVGSHKPYGQQKSDIMIFDKPKSDIMVVNKQNTDCGLS